MREALIDRAAIGANFSLLKRRHDPLDVMAVASGDAYGHGAVKFAKAAVAAGAGWLGTARIADAVLLRNAGLAVPILCWQHRAAEDFQDAVRSNITPAVSTAAAFATAVSAGIRSLHLILETGSGIPGLDTGEWHSVVRDAAQLQRSGRLDPIGIMITAGTETVAAGLSVVAAEKLEVNMVHDSVGSPLLGQAPYGNGVLTAVRSGAELFGLSESLGHSAIADGFMPAMTLRASIIGVKTAPGGTGVSYGYTYRTSGQATLALIPLGYGDGLDRSAGNCAPVWVGGRVYTIAGRVAMDACVVDLGEGTAAIGDDAVLFGDPALGYPGAEDWATALGTTSAAIVSRLTARVRRS